MRTLSDGLIHSDVAKLKVNNLSGMNLLEGNYDCCLQSSEDKLLFNLIPWQNQPYNNAYANLYSELVLTFASRRL